MSENEEEKRYKVFAKIKVMPEDPEADLESIKNKIEGDVPEDFKINKMEEEPVAFGLTSIVVTVLGPDAAGGFDPVEESWGEIDTVKEVSVSDVGRLWSFPNFNLHLKSKIYGKDLHGTKS